MKCNTPLIVLVSVIFLLSCRKDDREDHNKALLQGTWQFRNSISQTSITNNYNGETHPPVVTYDTLTGGTADVNATLFIKGDSMSYSSFYHQSIFSVSGATYALQGNTIAFSSNLLSYSGKPLFIQTLTAHQLTFFDHDTTSFTPLVTHEYQSTYTK